MKLYQITYQVEGSIPFPIDMLRYDASWPAHEGEQWPIVETINHENTQVRIVTLRTNRTRDWQPTAGRWQSFGWTVLEGSIELGPAL